MYKLTPSGTHSTHAHKYNAQRASKREISIREFALQHSTAALQSYMLYRLHLYNIYVLHGGRSHYIVQSYVFIMPPYQPDSRQPGWYTFTRRRRARSAAACGVLYAPFAFVVLLQQLGGSVRCSAFVLKITATGLCMRHIAST